MQSYNFIYTIIYQASRQMYRLKADQTYITDIQD